jgi:hypothetical protein
MEISTVIFPCRGLEEANSVVGTATDIAPLEEPSTAQLNSAVGSAKDLPPVSYFSLGTDAITSDLADDLFAANPAKTVIYAKRARTQRVKKGQSG